jgi:hypothetical protein
MEKAILEVVQILVGDLQNILAFKGSALEKLKREGVL